MIEHTTHTAVSLSNARLEFTTDDDDCEDKLKLIFNKGISEVYFRDGIEDVKKMYHFCSKILEQ